MAAVRCTRALIAALLVGTGVAKLRRWPSRAGIPPLTDGSCPNYSPTFPSKGGPDCGYSCASGARSVGTAFFSIFPKSFRDKISKAGELVRSIDAANTIYTEGSGSDAFMNSHISFSYYCCYSEDALAKIKAVLEAWDGWVPHLVNFGLTTCAIDGPALDHVSFIVRLDRESNESLMRWVQDLEGKIEAAGVPIHVPRREQEPYHVTLAVVNGTGYPVKKAIEALNLRFRPSKWLEEPLRLVKPCNAHGNTSEGFFC